MKEARRLGAIELSGIDAVQRLQWQYSLLKELVPLKISPRPISLLNYKDHSLLIIEKFGNLSLGKILTKSFDKKKVLGYLQKIAEILLALHK